MADNIDKDKDLLGDSWLSSWEAQCLDEWENESNMDERLHNRTENEGLLQKLWTSFQNSASSISQLYREGSLQNGVSLWVPFQNSASRVTLLYKESHDAVKKSCEHGNQFGYRRRTRDVLNWVKKRRRHIRREDLIAYLCGKAPPVRHHHHHRSSPALSRTPSRVAVGMGLDRSCSPRHGSSSESKDDQEPDLQPFRDALALQGLNGAMSNISVGRRSQAGVVEEGAAGVATARSTTATSDQDLHYFILDEMARRCDARKRSASQSETRMDSPNRKRNRLCFDDMEEL